MLKFPVSKMSIPDGFTWKKIIGKNTTITCTTHIHTPYMPANGLLYLLERTNDHTYYHTNGAVIHSIQPQNSFPYLNHNKHLKHITRRISRTRLTIKYAYLSQSRVGRKP